MKAATKVCCLSVDMKCTSCEEGIPDGVESAEDRGSLGECAHCLSDDTFDRGSRPLMTAARQTRTLRTVPIERGHVPVECIVYVSLDHV